MSSFAFRSSTTDAKSDGLQYIRAVAAWAVVYYHATVYLDIIGGFKNYFNVLQGRPGLYGVIAFFVVSGYLMASIAPKYDAQTFLTHRILRIYPIYWACVVFALCFYTTLWQIYLPNTNWIPDLWGMLYGGQPHNLLRLTLVPIVFPDAPLGIEWTLLYETTFYVLIYILISLKQSRWIHIWALAWLSLIVAVTVFRPAWQVNHNRPTMASFLVQVPNMAFILGLLGQKFQPRVNALFLLLIGGGAMVMIEYFDSRWAMHQVCFGIAALVLGVIGLEQQGWLPRSRVLKALGAWSYALYLIHVLVIFTVLKVASQWPHWAQMIAIASMALLFSYVFGQLDIYSYRRLKTFFDIRPAFIKRTLIALFLAMFVVVGFIGVIATRR